MFRIGWRAFRERLPLTVPSGRFRVAVIVGVLVAAVVGALGSWIAVAHAAGPTGWGAVALMAIGIGGIGAGCVPFGAYGVPTDSDPRSPDAAEAEAEAEDTAATGVRNPPAPTPPPSYDVRTTDRIARYFARMPGGRAPTIDPDDRELVLRLSDARREQLVRAILRSTLLGAGWVVAAGGLSLLDVPFNAFQFYWAFVLGLAATNVVRLGRVERARELAALLPDAPHVQRRSGTPNRAPRGSKLGLPGE
jgi:hypothetical protein